MAGLKTAADAAVETFAVDHKLLGEDRGAFKREGDTAESLAARLLHAEHLLYPMCVMRLLNKKKMDPPAPLTMELDGGPLVISFR